MWIADDVSRHLCARGKYRDELLPMTVLHHLDAILADGKQAREGGLSMALPAQPKSTMSSMWKGWDSIVADGRLWFDASLQPHARPGPVTGMNEIKQRRLTNWQRSPRL